MLAHVHDSELDSGPRMRTERARHCVVTRTVKPVDELIRFVVGPDGILVPDAKGKLPGRGVWITATRAGHFDHLPAWASFVRIPELGNVPRWIIVTCALTISAAG